MSSSHKKQNDSAHDDIEIVNDESEGTSASRRIGKSDTKLRDELHAANVEKQKYLEGWQRAQADLVNFKRTAETEKRGNANRIISTFIEELLPVLDSFDLAFGNKEAWESAPKNWRDGITYIHQQLLGVLRERGLEVFSPEGKPFDPHEHESIAAVTVTNPAEDGKVVAVVQKGYKIGETIVRPARVHVGHFEE